MSDHIWDPDDPGMTTQGPNAATILTGPSQTTFAPKVSSYPREGYCATMRCMSAISSKYAARIEERLTVLDPALQNPRLYVKCEQDHNPWVTHPVCDHPTCVEAATRVAIALRADPPRGSNLVPCLEPDSLLQGSDEQTEEQTEEPTGALTNELLHRLLADAQLEHLPNLVELFQEGLKDGSIKPTAPYTNKS